MKEYKFDRDINLSDYPEPVMSFAEFQLLAGPIFAGLED